MKEILLALLIFFVSSPVFADVALREFVKQQAHYWGIEASENELTQLVQLKQAADKPGLNQEQRTKAYTELFQFVQKLRALPADRVPAGLAASFWVEGAPSVPPSPVPTRPGLFGNYVKKGSGKTPVILIPDIGADWTVFESFMQRNATRFTFYAVTLPGFGGSAPPERSERLDFGRMKWWNNASAALLQLIAQQKLDPPLILGHQAGAYLAMKLALEKPEVVRGVIVLNGLLYAPLPNIPADASTAERIRIVNGYVPAELFPYPPPAHYFKLMLQNAGYLCKNKERQESLTRLLTRSGPTVWWNYFAELATTNLSEEIKKIQVPLLVLLSIHDQSSPGFESSKIGLDQWSKLNGSTRFLTVKPVEDCRAYITEDQPQKLDDLVGNWVKQRSD